MLLTAACFSSTDCMHWSLNKVKSDYSAPENARQRLATSTNIA